MNSLCFVLLSSCFSTRFYVFGVVVLLFIVFIILYAYRNNLINKWIRSLQTEQVEQIRVQVGKSMAEIHNELKIHASLAKENEKKLMTLMNEMHDLSEMTLNSIENNGRTITNEIISKLEQVALSNQESNRQLAAAVERSFEKSTIALQGLIKTNKQPAKTKVSENKREAEIVNTTIQTQDQLGEDIYYLPFPDSKGFFWDDQKHTAVKNNTVFVMNPLKNDPKRAYFRLLTNNQKIIKNALLNPKAFLKPVCEIVGNAMGQNITVLKEGELVLMNNKWMVVEGKKVKIKIS